MVRPHTHPGPGNPLHPNTSSDPNATLHTTQDPSGPGRPGRSPIILTMATHTCSHQDRPTVSSTASSSAALNTTFGGNAVWAATTPMTMVSGDWVSWQCTYEAA